MKRADIARDRSKSAERAEDGEGGGGERVEIYYLIDSIRIKIVENDVKCVFLQRKAAIFVVLESEIGEKGTYMNKRGGRWEARCEVIIKIY